MKDNNLSSLTKAELINRKKSLKSILVATVVVMLVLICFLSYLIITKHNLSLLTFIPISFLTIVPGLIKWSQLSAEIKLRDTNPAGL